MKDEAHYEIRIHTCVRKTAIRVSKKWSFVTFQNSQSRFDMETTRSVLYTGKKTPGGAGTHYGTRYCTVLKRLAAVGSEEPARPKWCRSRATAPRQILRGPAQLSHQMRSFSPFGSPRQGRRQARLAFCSKSFCCRATGHA